MKKVTRETPSGVKKKVVKKKARDSSSSSQEKSKNAFEIPTDLNEPPTHLWESILLIFGRKSIGKTSLANKFPKPFTLMFERARRNLKIRMQSPRTWQEARGWIKAAVKDSTVESVVIDTLERMFELCMNHICEAKDISHPNEANDWGQTWNEVKQEFEDAIVEIYDSGKAVILLSHETVKPITRAAKGLKRDDVEVSAVTISRLEPTLPGKAFEAVQEMCDFVLYYGYSDEHRTITVRSPHETVWAACGLEEAFLDPDGNPINTFKVGNSPELAYKSLLDAYGGKLRDVDYVPDSTPLSRPKKKVKKKVRS